MIRLRLVVAAVALGAFAIILSAPGIAAQAPTQAQPPVFRGDVTLVQVDARVFDGAGRFVPTLRREDFDVFERGVRQPIESLELIGYSDPLVAGDARPVLARGRAASPHTWIFQFDRKHLSPGQFARVRTAVELFIQERFIDGDIAGIVDGDKMVFDKISSSRAELLAAIRRIKPSGDQAGREADDQYVDNITGDDEAAEAMRDALKPFGAAETRRAALDMLDTTSDLFDGLAAIAGAKTVVLVSGGFVMGREVEGSVRSAVSRGVRAGVRVYAIDPLGLQRVGGPPDLLNTLSVDTGGMVIFNENNFARALDAIAADTGVYYLLGVRPLNRKFDGRYREIDVRVKVPGVTVRARRGYLAVDPSTLRSPSGR